MSGPTRLFRSFSPRRLVGRAALSLGRVTRGMTLGVRAVLLNDDRIILVRHTYTPGWYLPGGGVEAGESFNDALVREVREEAGVHLTGPALLFGIYRSARTDPRDHVALYVCREWTQPEPPRMPNLEIRACEAFRLDDLPEDITAGTKTRLGEVLGGLDPATDW